MALKSWPEAAADLVGVAAGHIMAEVVIKGGQWVNVHSREVIPNTDIAIHSGRFCLLWSRRQPLHRP